MHVMNLEKEYKAYWMAMKKHRSANDDAPMRDYCKALRERLKKAHSIDAQRESAISYITEGCGLEF